MCDEKININDPFEYLNLDLEENEIYIKKNERMLRKMPILIFGILSIMSKIVTGVIIIFTMALLNATCDKNTTIHKEFVIFITKIYFVLFITSIFIYFIFGNPIINSLTIPLFFSIILLLTMSKIYNKKLK